MYSDCSLHFIRHAETSFNQATEDFKKSTGHFASFDELSKLPDFRNGVRFNPVHIDCPITQKGIVECQLAKDQLKKRSIKPDLVLVSPFNRGLETNYHIFGTETKIPVIVEPLIGQIFKSSCDISSSLDQKLEKYPWYDFGECMLLGNKWYLLKNSQNHQEHFKHIIQRGKAVPDFEQFMQVIDMMDQRDLVQTQEHLYERCQRFLDKIRQKYAPIYKQIVVVTHFMFINCISSKEYERETFQPKSGLRPKNCEISSLNLSDLMQKSFI